MPRSRCGIRWAGAVAFLLLASQAEAHTEFSTKGPFVSGIKHYFLSLDDVLVTLALGIVASQNAARTAREVWWVLPSTWWLAGVVGLFGNHAVPGGALWTAGSLLIVGLLAALSLAPPAGWIFLLTLLVGALHGYQNGAAMQPETLTSGLGQLGGIAASALLVVVYPGVLLDIFKQPWTRIVARVAGSWIAATGLLLIGWTLRVNP